VEECKKQKSRRGAAAKNRYAAGAKLSEHKFLRILEGYAEAVPIMELEPTTHVSGKTIRGTYRALRAHLPLAVQRERARFSGAGEVLFAGGMLSPDGNRLLSDIERTRRFARYVRSHAPRINSAEEERLLLVEKAVRVMCAVDLRGVEVDERLLAEIGDAFAQLRVREPLGSLVRAVPRLRAHAHPSLRLYEDYRRSLLKQPLRAVSSSVLETDAPL